MAGRSGKKQQIQPRYFLVGAFLVEVVSIPQETGDLLGLHIRPSLDPTNLLAPGTKQGQPHGPVLVAKLDDIILAPVSRVT